MALRRFGGWCFGVGGGSSPPVRRLRRSRAWWRMRGHAPHSRQSRAWRRRAATTVGDIKCGLTRTSAPNRRRGMRVWRSNAISTAYQVALLVERERRDVGQAGGPLRGRVARLDAPDGCRPLLEREADELRDVPGPVRSLRCPVGTAWRGNPRAGRQGTPRWSAQVGARPRSRRTRTAFTELPPESVKTRPPDGPVGSLSMSVPSGFLWCSKRARSAIVVTRALP